MPLHIHPVLRAREEALEADGLIKPLDSVAVQTAKIQEADGTKVKVVPVATKRVIRGTLYTAS